MQSNQVRRRFAFALTAVFVVLCSTFFLRPAKSVPSTANSFVSGTKVWTESGPRAIETLQTGDLVWVEDEEHGKVELKPVTETDEQQVSTTLLVTFTNGEKIETVVGRPIYVEGSGFKNADQLATGDSIVTRVGPSLPIASVQQQSQSKTVRSLSVAASNTYFVGDSGFWVSN